MRAVRVARELLRGGIDRLGVVVVLLIATGLLYAPFATVRANRIVLGEARAFWDSLPHSLVLVTGLIFVLAAAASLVPESPRVRFTAGIAGLACLAIAIAAAAIHLTPPADRLARVAPGSGFWLLLLALALLVTDALARLSPPPARRIAMLALALAALIGILASGLWDGLSVMREYHGRAGSFWNEARQHMFLAFGSMAVAVAAGIPLGLACHRAPALRGPVLNALNIVQTIPSIALFGLLIAPLAWISANLPGAASLGIRGIGTAPAFIALFLYSLLPVVANTITGLASVPAAVNDAALGMGMTAGQRLARVGIPLAFPVLLTGIRIVLVQNIGLATIAALIGGGGFGVFVFQGIGQMAMDLVLLGALPTVILALASAIVLDALAEISAVPTGREVPS